MKLDTLEVAVDIQYVLSRMEAFFEASAKFDRVGPAVEPALKRLATAATFVRSCVVQALRRGNESRHWLQASV